MNDNTIGKQIKAARKRAGYTQGELAEKLNISQSYISRIEKKVIKRIKETIKL